MRVLIVDNHTSRLAEIRTLLSGCEIQNIDVVRTEELKQDNYDAYDLIVLTGATGLSIPPNMEVFKNELELIRKREKPLLGICSGFQAISVAFGAKLQYRPEGVRGVVDIEVMKPDPIFGGKNNFKVYESHKYFLEETPPGLTPLARSIFNIEVIKHVSRPTYGFQFHPEVDSPENDGSVIFQGFMTSVVGEVKSYYK
jgi:GMP synthase-like glutamine amidotransferase